MLLLRWFAPLLFAVSLGAHVHAATLFGVISDRAAPRAAETARLYLDAHPGDRIVLRTPGQLLTASDKQARRWLLEADTVLAVAVFGDGARRLETLLQRDKRPETPFLAFNGHQLLSARTHQGNASLSDVSPETLRQLSSEAPSGPALATAHAHLLLGRWLAARQTWQAGGTVNVARLFAHQLRPQGELPPPLPEPTLRLRLAEREFTDAAAWGANTEKMKLAGAPTLVVLDLANADPLPADMLCAESRRQKLPCVVAMARWGSTSREIVERLPQLIAPAHPAAIVVLQDFVVGAAEGREAVTAALARLGVPVLKAMRLTERTATQWRLSADGLPADTVQYRVALPELQGSGQPIVIAANGRATLDTRTGVEIKRPEMLPAELSRLVGRAVRWQHLQTKANRDKRVAIVYYNHPPGRQNIGADNLDVPASLFDILHAMKAAGYTVGKLPASPAELLEQIMKYGVNLPEDRQALREMALDVAGVGTRDYASWFARLPARVRGEMVSGPLGRLHAEVLEAEAAGERVLGRHKVDSVMKELHHLVAGAEHAQRRQALQLLERLSAGYAACLSDPPRHPCARLAGTLAQLTALKLEGLRGWGAPPAR